MRPDLAILLFLILLGTYAYFWQSRDWNAASRLMLTYALVDRHQLEIDGLEGQAGERGRFNRATRRYEMIAGDLAQVGGHFYSDKAPGQSLLGVLVYAPAKYLGGLPGHPLDEREARAYWPADYWVTLGTSGLLTAGLAVVIYAFCLRLGTTQFGGVLLGLAYGLGTPAFLYATLFYGHQASAFCTVTSFFLLHRAAHESRANVWTMLLSGLLAGYAVVLEYQVVMISAVLALYAVVAIRRVRPLVTFLIGAVLSVSLLAAYNYRAFGNPLDMGYAHEVFAEFRIVHSADNPLGLRVPKWGDAQEILAAILWGRFRGLAFYAPILLAAPLGLFGLLWRRCWGVALVAVVAVGWMLLVNVSYPKWEGGWCTGPRLLVPAIPFAVLAVAGLIGVDRRGVLTTGLVFLAVTGGVLMLSCVAVGGRFFPSVFDPDTRRERRVDPVREIVLPHWRGKIELYDGAIAGGRQFEWNAGRWMMERGLPRHWLPPEPSAWQDLQMAPLVVCWLAMISLVIWRCRRLQNLRTPARQA